MIQLIKVTIAWVFLLALWLPMATSQKVTNSGTEFWLAFPEMFDRNTTNSDYWLNITSNTSAAGTVTIPGTSFSAPFSVTPGAIAKVNLPRNDVYLNGSDSIFNRAIHVSSNNEVVVYAVHLKRPRHEATLVLPNRALGPDYRITTYRSEQIGATLYESEFVVVATGDTAVVEIVPTGDIAGGPLKGVPYQITLLPGEVYQAQALADSVDLTGTTIKSVNGKNVAVYAGNVWIQVVCNGARDPLLEVMYPTNTWGKSYFALPTPLVLKDYIKVLADEDTTILFRDGVFVDTLNAGEFFEDTIITNRHYTANKPISVAEVLVSGGGPVGCNSYNLTDPSMVMLNPTEQMFLDSISFFAVDDPSAQLDTNFVHVVTFSTDTALVFLDSVKLGGFQQFTQDPKYSFRSIGVKAGFHRLETKGCGFLAYSMGMGNIISYAYATGVSLVDLDNAITFTNAIDGSDTICLGDTVQFKSVSFANAFSFKWDFGDGNTDTLENPTHGYATNGTYVVSLTTNYSCATVTTSDTVEVPPTPIVDLGPDTTLCEGDSLTFTVNTHVFKAFWSDSSTNQFLTVTKPGNYWVEVSNFCGADTDSVVVNIITADSLNAGPDSTICQFTPYRLGGNPTSPGNPTYLWSPNTDLDSDTIANPIYTPTTSGATSYILAITRSNGCVLRDTVNFNVLSSAAIDAGENQIICDDTTTTIRLGGNPTGAPSSNFVWGPAGELNNPNTANPTTKSGTTRWYYLLVEDTSGCKNVDSVFVSRFGFDVSGASIDCGGDSAQLQISNVLGANPIKYLWKPNYALTSDTIANPISFPDSTTLYTVVVSDSLGCIDSTQVRIDVSDKVNADFDLVVKASCTDALITTHNLSTNAIEYEWFLNGNSISTDVDTRERVAYASDNLIKLIVKSKDQCVDSTEKQAFINAISEFKTDSLPNVFTPNDDGINDLLDFSLGNDLNQCSQVFVYNRWGVLIFESSQGHPIWDGRTFAGNKVDDGVYFFTLEVNGTEHKGYVQVVR
ncbi:MAG: hypothetical protein CL840_14645 [Crocinitomicaceae bacterium]|nr:hypothetical protein [Crocinitomicaceae bacterium]|tara:strand:- start:3455 stop:6490 length:3036 start_codon:yes stop_codon:yes gene_type:complete